MGRISKTISAAPPYTSIAFLKAQDRRNCRPNSPSGTTSRLTQRPRPHSASRWRQRCCSGPTSCTNGEREEGVKGKLLGVCAALASTTLLAGPEKIKFPSDYLKGVLYQTLDRPDNKQYRELYAPASAIEAVRKGQPIPHGTVLTLVQWSVQQDDKGNPLKDASGRFIKKEIIAHTVMEKQRG